MQASFECEMRNSHVHVSDCFVINKIYFTFVFPSELIHGTFQNMCVECSEVAPGYTNAQPPGCNKIADAPPWGLTP